MQNGGAMPRSSALTKLLLGPPAGSESVFEPVFDFNRQELLDLCAGGPALPDIQCQNLPGGLDHAAAGEGLRNTGQVTIELRGVPTGAEPVYASIFLGAIENAPDYPRITFDGQIIPGQLIGGCQEPCWDSGLTFYAYEYPFLDQLQAGINGEYPISLQGFAGGGGESPWDLVQPAPPYLEGATLLVVYSHALVDLNSRVSIHQGPARLDEELVVEHPLDEPLSDLTQIRHTRIGADGQSGRDLEPTDAIRTYIDLGSGWIQIRGPGSSIDPNQDWQGLDGGPINRLWDTQVDLFRVDADGYLSGAMEYRVRYESATAGQPVFLRDCVAVIVHAMTTINVSLAGQSESSVSSQAGAAVTSAPAFVKP